MTAAAEPNAGEFQGALTTSFIFHGAVLLALIFGLPHLKPDQIEMVQPIAVDIIDLGPVTTTQVQGTGQVAKKSELAPAPQPPAPPKPAQKPAPPPPAPKEKPADVKPDDQGALDKLIKSESKKTDAKPKPDKKPDDQQFGSLLKNLSTSKPADAAADDKTPDNAAAAGAPGIVASKLTISEEDALRRQIEQCWNVPMGAKDAQNLIIEIHLEINPDRTVKSADIVNTDRMPDPYFRAAAESAQRAVLNPKCSPLQLPEDKAEMWHSMTLRFNPQDVL